MRGAGRGSPLFVGAPGAPGPFDVPDPPDPPRKAGEMSCKTYVPEGEAAPASQVGATLEALAATIAARREAGEESYTHRLLTADVDAVLKKVMEEAGEVALAAKDADTALYFAGESADVAPDTSAAVRLAEAASQSVDHLRYEAADVAYHLLVVLERFGIGLDEFAAELNNRMTEDERPAGAVRLYDDYVRRGK